MGGGGGGHVGRIGGCFILDLCRCAGCLGFGATQHGTNLKKGVVGQKFPSILFLKHAAMRNFVVLDGSVSSDAMFFIAIPSTGWVATNFETNMNAKHESETRYSAGFTEKNWPGHTL